MANKSRDSSASPRTAVLDSFTRSRIRRTRLRPGSSTKVRYTSRANGQEDGEEVRGGRGGREGGGRGWESSIEMVRQLLLSRYSPTGKGGCSSTRRYCHVIIT